MPDVAIRFTPHALEQARRRGIDPQAVHRVVESPEQVISLREFRQSLVEGRAVVRVLVDVTEEEIVVVTMYRTSKVDTYWKPDR